MGTFQKATVLLNNWSLLPSAGKQVFLQAFSTVYGATCLDFPFSLPLSYVFGSSIGSLGCTRLFANLFVANLHIPATWWHTVLIGRRKAIKAQMHTCPLTSSPLNPFRTFRMYFLIGAAPVTPYCPPELWTMMNCGTLNRQTRRIPLGKGVKST